VTADGDSPIFIFGIGRTGTTLLARMLDRHPDVSIYLESSFLNVVPAGAAEATLDDAAARRLLDRMPDPADQGVSRDAILRRFATTDQSVRALFDTSLRLRMEAHGKRIFGEKTPSHFAKVDVLRAWYPDARFVYLLRDPRDAYASFTHSRDHATVAWMDRTLLGRCLYWNYYRHAVAAAKRGFPARVHEVEFAALVRDPDGTLRDLCSFLHLAYDPNMRAVAENNSSFAETREARGLRTEVLDRKDRLRPWQTTAIEILCGERMKADDLPLPAGSRRVVGVLSALGAYALTARLHRAIRARRKVPVPRPEGFAQ
jgi:hypothetical protein